MHACRKDTKNYKSLEEAYIRLEPHNIGDFNLKNKVLEPICVSWLARLISFRTAFLRALENIFNLTCQSKQH